MSSPSLEAYLWKAPNILMKFLESFVDVVVHNHLEVSEAGGNLFIIVHHVGYAGDCRDN